jgi:hypothetical protein
MSKTKYLAITVSLVVIGIAMLIVFIRSDRNASKLLRHRVFTNGLVSDVVLFPGGDGLWVKYTFRSQTREVTEKERIFIPKREKDSIRTLLLNSHFPVVYDSTDDSNCRLLLTKTDFAAFSIPYPDSLAERLAILHTAP